MDWRKIIKADKQSQLMNLKQMQTQQISPKSGENKNQMRV